MAITDATGFPVAAHVESASPHEVKLVEATIDSSFTRHAPDKLIGDKAYDGDKLEDQLLSERGVEMISPHRMGRKKTAYPRRQEIEMLPAQMEGRVPVCLASKL